MKRKKERKTEDLKKKTNSIPLLKDTVVGDKTPITAVGRFINNFKKDVRRKRRHKRPASKTLN